jgi:hypothetical protein
MGRLSIQATAALHALKGRRTNDERTITATQESFETFTLKIFEFASQLLAIRKIGRGGTYVSETSRLPHFLDNRLTDGGEFGPYAPAALYPQENSWYSFLLEAESTTRS